MSRAFVIGSFIALAAAVCPSVATAQVRDRLGNPAIPVELAHPPSLGIQAKRIAFGPASGPCADQLIDMLTQDFVGRQVDVVDRQHLEALTREHNFALSGYVDQTTAAQLGRILGPTAVVFVKVQRCAPEKKSLYQDRQTYKNGVLRVNISRTQFFFKGSVQTVDLATGRIFAAANLENNPSRQNESTSGIPEFPSEFELQDLSLHEAEIAINHMFFPWNETRKLIFFDDSDCNLKQAYQMVKNHLGSTVDISRQNLQTCETLPKADPKALAHAKYNVGMSYFIAGDHNNALSYLQQAALLRPGDVVGDAIAFVTEARNSAAAIQRVEQSVALEAENNARRSQQAEAAAAAMQPKTLAVADVVAMKQAALSDDLIEAAIRKNNKSFDLSVDDMVRLKTAGISETLIKVMLNPAAPATPHTSKRN